MVDPKAGGGALAAFALIFGIILLLVIGSALTQFV